jgi:hypothetical protein
MDDELRRSTTCVNFSQAASGASSGSIHGWMNLIPLVPDVATVFPGEQAVNQALRPVMRLVRVPQVDRQSVVEGRDESQMNTQAIRVITLPDNPALGQLSEMACPEECRITGCHCNRNVEERPNSVVSWRGITSGMDVCELSR